MKNKKKYLFLIFITITSLSTAQIRVGLHAGLNISNMLPWDEKMTEYATSEAGPKLGPNFGFTFDGNFSKHWGFITALNYSQLGYITTKDNPIIGLYSVKRTYTNSKILVPLDLSYNFKINKYHFFLFGGPGFGWSIQRKTETAVSGYPYPYGYNPYNTSQNVSSNYQTSSSNYSYTTIETSIEPAFELFANAGLGFEFKDFTLKSSCEAFASDIDANPRILNFNITLSYYIGKF